MKKPKPFHLLPLLLVAIIYLATALRSSAVIFEHSGQADGLDHSAVHPHYAPMLDHVGSLGNRRTGSAVYLGKNWIITAHHAFTGRSNDQVYFAGKSYRMKSRRAVRLKNPAGTGADKYTDLVMVPLSTSPDLPPLKLAKQTPFSGETVVMIGCGVSQEPGSVERALTDTESDPTSRMVPISDTDSDEEGSGPRWGQNVVAERSVSVSLPDRNGVTSAFVTIRQPKPTGKDAQGASGDSGGGVFVNRGEDWHLSGIMVSVLKRDDMNASATFIADLSVYRSQIESTIPEPSSGALLLVAGLFGCMRRRRSFGC